MSAMTALRVRATKTGISASSAFQCLHEHGDLDCCEIGKRVGDCIRQNDLIAMPHRATCINDVWHISFALGWLGADQWLARSGEHFGRIVLIEQNRSD